jgi:hypothetical protein
LFTRKEKKMDGMDIDTQLGTEFDPAGENIAVSSSDDVVAQGAEDQELGESQTAGQEAGDEVDLGQQFAFTGEDGQEVVLTGQQIVDLLKAQQAEPAKEEAKAEEQPPEAKEEAEEPPYQVVPIEFNKVGPDLVSMLEGENGGVEALGPAMAEFQFQTFLQDGRFLHAISQVVEHTIEQRQKAAQETSSFKDFVGEADAKEVAAFQKSNPWAKTKELALVGMQLAAQKAENERLKSGNTEALTKAQLEGQKAGELQTIKNLKAKGTLRVIGAKTKQSAPQGDDLKTKYDIRDPEQRTKAMVEAVLRMRGQG